MALTKDQLAAMYADETGNEVATVEKQEPVQTTDVPVQEEENQASTSESSGDSSVTPSTDTEETKTLATGNQVVDGIEYTSDGVEIGPYTEGKNQQILESNIKSEEDDTFVEGRHKVHRNKEIDLRNRGKKLENIEANDEEFNLNIQKRQSQEAEDFFLKSDKFQAFQNNFNEFSQQKIQEKAAELTAANPNMSEEDFNAKLTTYQETLWGDAIAGSSQIQGIMTDAEQYAQGVTQGDIDNHYATRERELVSIGLEDANFLQQVGIGAGANPYAKGSGSLAGDALFTIGTSFDSYIVETFDSFVQSAKKDTLKTYNNIQKTHENLLAKGVISKEKYETLTAENEVKRQEAKMDYTEDFLENSQDAQISAALKLTVADSDSPEAYTFRNTVLNMAEQLPNLIPGLFAANPIGAAAGLIFFGQQLTKEYEEKTNQVIASKMFGIEEGQATEEQLIEASTSPLGLAQLAKNRGAGLLGAIPSVILSRLQIKGGNLGKAFPALGKFLNNSAGVAALNKSLNKIAGNKLYNVGKYPVRLAGTVGGEVQEELGQESLGDFRADQVRTPERSTGSLLYDAAARVVPGNWSKEYKDVALVTFLSAGGSTALSQVAGGVREVGKVALDRKDILKLSKLNPEQFKVKVEIEKAALNQIIDKPSSTEEEKTAARNAIYSVLDTEFAYNDLQNHPNIDGNNRVEALQLLQERAGLRRQIDLLGNSGLSQPAKEREKIIDEKLAGIQKRSNEGETGSVFDKIRNAVKPKQSVGAARKQTVPQKIANAVQKISNVAGDTVLNALERVYSRPQGIGKISSVARQLRHLKPDDVSNDKWERQINEAVNAIEETGEAPKPTLDTDFKESIQQDIVKDETAEGKIGTRTQKKVEKFYHDQNLAVPTKYTDQFTGEYKAPTFEQAEAKQGLDAKPKNATEAARFQTQAALDRVIAQKEADRQLDAALASAPSIGLAQRRNIAQSIRNEGYKPGTITKPKSAIERELNQFDKNFKGKKNEAKFAHLRAKLENLLAQVEIVDQAVVDKINEVANGAWDKYSAEVTLYEEALRAEAVSPEVLQRYSKELAERNTAMRKLYSLGLRTIEVDAFNEGAKSGVFPPGFDPKTRKFDFTFKPDDYKPSYAQYFGTEAAYKSQNVNEWFNVLKDLEFINNIQTEINQLDVEGRTPKDVKRIETLMKQRETRKDKLEAKVKKDLRKTKKKLVENLKETPPADQQKLLEELAKLKKTETTEETDADAEIKKVLEQEGRKKAIDKQRPTRKKDLLYSDKKSQLETDIVYNALISTNKKLSDKELNKLFSSKTVAFAQGEHGLAGLGDLKSNDEDLRLLVDEYIELFGEESLAVLYEVAKEIRYLQDVGQRAVHGSILAQAALVQSINPWINKLVKGFTADTFRGEVTAAQKANLEVGSIFVAELDKEALKTAAVDGALKAIQSWDPAKGKFITYATSVVQGEMKAALDRFTGKSTDSTIDDYNRQRLESMDANVAKSKLEIARYLYIKGIDENLGSDIAEAMKDEANQLNAGIAEMAGNSDINADPRVAPVLSDKLKALSNSLASDPRARKIAFASSQITKLTKLAEIKDIDVSHYISQYSNQINSLKNPATDPSSLPLITVPEGVLNTRGGYLDSGQNIRVARFNQLKALPAPNSTELAELGLLEKGLTTEIDLIVEELGGSISVEDYQAAGAQNEFIPQQIKEVETRMEESSFDTKSVLLGTGPEAGVTPEQEEQIASNKNVVDGQMEVKKVLQKQMLHNNLIQLGAETGKLKVIDSNGAEVNVTKELAGKGSVAKTNLSLGTYIPPITTTKEAVEAALPIVSTLGTHQSLAETNAPRTALVEASFAAMTKFSEKAAVDSYTKQQVADKIAKTLSNKYNKNPKWDEELNMWHGGVETTFEDYQHSTVHINEDGSMGFDAATQALQNSDPYAVEDSTIFFTGLNDVTEAKELLPDSNDSLTRATESSGISGILGEGTGGSTADYTNIYIVRKEVDLLQDISVNIALLDQFKSNALEGKNLSEFQGLAQTAKEQIAEYTTWVKGIDSAVNDGIVGNLVALDAMIDNTLKIAANPAVGQATVDKLAEYTTISDELGLPAPSTEVPPKTEAPKSNSGKLYTFAPALVLLLPGVGIDFDAIQPILDGLATMYDAIMHVASLVFGSNGATELSMASIIPFGAFTNFKYKKFDSEGNIKDAANIAKARKVGFDKDVAQGKIDYVDNRLKERFGWTEGTEAFIDKYAESSKYVFANEKTSVSLINQKRRNETHADSDYLVFEDYGIMMPIRRGNIQTILYLDTDLLTLGDFERRASRKQHFAQQEQARKEVQADILTELYEEFLGVGTGNKLQAINAIYDKNPKIQSLWNTVEGFKESMIKLTGMTFPKNDSKHGKKDATFHDLQMLEAKGQVSKLLVKEGQVYSNFDKDQTDILLDEVNSILVDVTPSTQADGVIADIDPTDNARIREEFKKFFNMSTEATRLNGLTPHEQLQFEAMQETAGFNENGTISIYRGINLQKGQVVNQALDIRGWSIDPSIAKAQAEGTGTQAVIAIKVKPNDLLLNNNEVIFNPNLPFPQITYQGDSNMTLETRVNEENNNDKICM